MRYTKIVCTLGPKSRTVEDIHMLIEQGMNVARINLSHGTREDHTQLIEHVRAASQAKDIFIGIMLDTRGPEIRTGDTDQPIVIKKNQKVLFSPHPIKNTKSTPVIRVNYDRFSDDVKETKEIIVDGGALLFSILEIKEDGTVRAQAKNSGSISSRRHINLPGADIDQDNPTKGDRDDIAFAIEQNVDFIALSFVRNADEVSAVKDMLTAKESHISLIAKIETAQSLESIQEIIRTADGILVARGDLGAEIPYEKLPAIQDSIVSLCIDAGKPVIVATHMLESMKDSPTPTRAEVTDVAHAAMTGTDATMLSGETAAGKYPCESIDAMDRILSETEALIARFPLPDTHLKDSFESNLAQALTENEDISAIVAVTSDLQTLTHISKFRLPIPIYCVTADEEIARKSTLLFGIFPFKVSEDTEALQRETALHAIKDVGGIAKDNDILLIQDHTDSAESALTIDIMRVG